MKVDVNLSHKHGDGNIVVTVETDGTSYEDVSNAAKQSLLDNLKIKVLEDTFRISNDTPLFVSYVSYSNWYDSEGSDILFRIYEADVGHISPINGHISLNKHYKLRNGYNGKYINDGIIDLDTQYYEENGMIMFTYSVAKAVAFIAHKYNAFLSYLRKFIPIGGIKFPDIIIDTNQIDYNALKEGFAVCIY